MSDAPAADIPHLPEILRRVEAQCGQSLALAVAREFGGRRMTLPSRAMTPQHALARRFGLRQGKAIAAAIGETGPITVPRAAAAIRWAEARRLRAAGWTIPAIARELSVTERWVHALVQGVDPAATDATDAPTRRTSGPSTPSGGKLSPADGGGDNRPCPVCGRRHRRQPKAREPAPLPLFEGL